MNARRIKEGITWIRPFLTENRETLRKFLRKNNVQWSEDPSNQDPRFARVRLRQAMTQLADLGLEVGNLVQVAQNMADARAALNWYTFLAAQEVCRLDRGVVVLNANALRTFPSEICRRLLVHAILWVNGAEYPPRRASMKHVQDLVKQEKSATLDGCQIHCKNAAVYIFREMKMLRDETCEVGDVWDNRWSITGPEDDPELTLRPLGKQGIKAITDWRQFKLPYAAVLSQPALWKNAELIAAPTLNYGKDWTITLERDEDTFFSMILSH